MPRDMAVKFFHSVGVGTPVTIADHAPKGRR
jgi:hypothetical protein